MKHLTLAIATVCVISSCKKDSEAVDPGTPPNEEELITTLNLHFHSTGDAEHKHFSFTDLDGDGGNAPVIEADTLSADSTYSVEIEVLDESGTPVEDITAEILAEGTAHQFFFQFTGVNANATYSDTDANGAPIGLLSAWTMGLASTGNVVVTLRHEPDKSAAGVSVGDITNAGGETDIEVSFPVVIE